MNRDEFIEHLRAGKSATEAVRKITGEDPYIVTIASIEDDTDYTRYGVMMAGSLMAALVILRIYIPAIPPSLLDRIRTGEPCGDVLSGIRRFGSVIPYPGAIQARGRLHWAGPDEKPRPVGMAQEIFTGSLFNVP